MSSEDTRVRGHVARRRKAREPKLVETVKTCVLLKGHKASERVSHVLRDLGLIKHDTAVTMTRKNDMLPMEDPSGLEHLCRQHDAGLFIFANTNKKRPDNVILGRTFDGQVLDMVELGVTNFESIEQVQKAAGTSACMAGCRPLVVFRGEAFSNALAGSDMDTLKSLLIDMFRGRTDDELDLEALDLVLVFTSDLEGKRVEMRGYRLAFGKPARTNGAPSIGLQDHGPSIDFVLRRSRIAAPAMAKFARKQAKLPGSGKQKNVSTDVLKGKVGRVHMTKQDTSKLVTRSRFRKALKRSQGEKDDTERKRVKKH